MFFLSWVVSLSAHAESQFQLRNYTIEDSAYSWNVESAFDRRQPESGIDLFAIEQRRALYTAGLEQKFNEKLSVDLGFNLSQNTLDVDPVNYQDFFVGVNYGSIGGRIWYRDQADMQEEKALYYEAGWSGAVTRDTSISFQFGQEYQAGRFTQSMPDLSISAQTNFRGYNFGVRVIDHSGFGMNTEQDFSLIGSFQKRFP